jgi:FixJ family two-component response regulator
VGERGAVESALARRVWIVDDEPAAATLAEELCASNGALATIFRAPLPFLGALRESDPPDAVILDWRLERELSAALFLATRHRYPGMPVIYWTGSPVAALPGMVRTDERVSVVDKAAGAVAFERALEWAFDQPAADS